MPNNLGLAGSQPSKPPKFAPIFTSRFFSGLWTNRSPLRDATTSRLVEHYYGQAGDALIAGTNVEITNKLTLARRPGNTQFDTNTYTDPDRFYSFRLFSSTNPTDEEIDVIIDQANAIYSQRGGTLTDIFTKSAGSGQAYFQSVGDILYFGDGVETKKWLQTLNTWTAATLYGTDSLPFMTSFVFDSVGNIQQALGTYFPFTEIAISAPTATVDPIITLTSSVDPRNILTVGDILTFPIPVIPFFAGSPLPSPYNALNDYSVTILTISSTQVTTTYPANSTVPFTLPAGPTATPGAFAYAINNGTPLTGSVVPSFSALVPGTLNHFQGGYTIDNQVVWVNRGLPVENWGIVNTPTTPLVPVVSPASTFAVDPLVQISSYVFSPGSSYSSGSYVLDPNGNIQYATIGGTTGSTVPIWTTILDETTTDGTITWTLVYIGAMTALNGGWRYGVALVNTLDNTVSNCCPLSDPTGNFVGAQGIFIPAGAGIPSITRRPLSSLSQSVIDPQADYVAIFRTTDGQAVPFLIPGQDGQTYTIRLSDYLLYGYTDTTLDVNLNNLISGAVIGENTPPLTTAINLTYHLNRIW